MPRVGENGQEQQEQQQHQHQDLNVNLNQQQNQQQNQQPQLLNVMSVATHLNIGDTQLTQVARSLRV